MNIEYVDKDTVVCEDDHPRVYYRLNEGKATCGYCNKKFIHISKRKEEDSDKENNGSATN
tara:strand:- start:135 stop:314 length:180 start_codon:yes stop_codon:yes gene_type:complete